MTSAAFWKVRGLTAGYGERCVLEPLDLDLPLGCITSVVGPGGSGKTTFLRALAGIDRPAEMWIRGGAEAFPHGMLLVPQLKRGAALSDVIDVFEALDTVDQHAVVLLDEPFVPLDPPSCLSLYRRIAELRGSHTMICVTHNLRHAREISDHMILIADGRLVESAAAPDFFERPKHSRTADFLVTGS